MKTLLSALILSATCLVAFAGQKYSTEETDIATLLADPQAQAILEKYLPQTISNPQFSMAHSFTLAFISSFDQTGELTDENLAKIDAEFAVLAADAEE